MTIQELQSRLALVILGQRRPSSEAEWLTQLAALCKLGAEREAKIWARKVARKYNIQLKRGEGEGEGGPYEA